MEKDKIDFIDCPHYNNVHKTIADINELHNGHRMIVKQLKHMAKDNKRRDKLLSKHMEEEEKHHTLVADSIKESNDAVLGMGDKISTLMDDKLHRDEVKDKRESIKEKVIAAVLIAITIGAYNLFIDLMKLKQLMTGE